MQSELDKIISGLIVKSKRLEVNWFHTSDIDPTVSPESDDYTVSLEKSSINIYRYENQGNKVIAFSIYNSRGKEIMKEVFESFDYPNFSKLEELINLAANKADNIDETIESIKKQLSSSGEIGHLKGNDIPF